MSNIWSSTVDDFDAWASRDEITTSTSTRAARQGKPPAAPRKKANGAYRSKKKEVHVTGPAATSTTIIGGGEGSDSRPVYASGREYLSANDYRAQSTRYPQSPSAGHIQPSLDRSPSTPRSRTFTSVPDGLRLGHRQELLPPAKNGYQQGHTAPGVGERGPPQPAHLVCRKTPSGQAQLGFLPVAAASSSSAPRPATFRPAPTVLDASSPPQGRHQQHPPSRPQTAMSSTVSSPFLFDPLQSEPIRPHGSHLPSPFSEPPFDAGYQDRSVPFSPPAQPFATSSRSVEQPDYIGAQVNQIFQEPYNRSSSATSTAYGLNHREPFSPVRPNAYYAATPMYSSGPDRREALYDGVFNRDDQEETKRSKRVLQQRYAFGKGRMPKTWSTLSGQGRSKYRRGGMSGSTQPLAHIERTRAANLPATPSLGAAAASGSARSVGSIARTHAPRLSLRPSLPAYPTTSSSTIATPSKRAHSSSFNFDFTSPRTGETPPTPAMFGMPRQRSGPESAISLVSSESDCEDD